MDLETGMSKTLIAAYMYMYRTFLMARVHTMKEVHEQRNIVHEQRNFWKLYEMLLEKC